MITAIPLESGARRTRTEDVANLRPGVFTGLAPLREDDDVVRVKRVGSVEQPAG